MSTPAGYRVLDVVPEQDVNREFAVDVLVGLSERPKHLPSRWFYDARGSELFQQITDLEEYYLTSAEHEVLAKNAARICAAGGESPFNLVDLGAGDGRKTFLLLDHLEAAGAEVRYVPIDVSEAAMIGLVDEVRRRCPGIEVQGLVSEYFRGIDWLARNQASRRNLVLFLGSNIGNFELGRARHFLRRLWSALEPDDRVLIGFDLKKDPKTLVAAYDDPRGVTRAFNLNLLERINRELGGRFDLSRFVHYSTYNVFRGAMESYLLSVERQSVLIEALQREFQFRPWEPIHTEYSFKYSDEDIARMAQETGFEVEQRLWDEGRRFCDALWRVEKVR